MAGTELKIEDDSVTSMGTFLSDRATNLQSAIDNYIEILSTIRQDAIKKGDTAEALDKFISYAKNLSNVVSSLGDTAKSACTKFLDEIDEKDEYLFEKGE